VELRLSLCNFHLQIEHILNFCLLQNTRKRQEATFDEQMAALQDMRTNLTARRGMIERQIRDLETKIEEKKQRSAEGVMKDRPEGGQ